MHLASAFVLVLSNFMESTLTIIMAASLPIFLTSFSVFDRPEVFNRTSQTQSRASTAFWHDRGRPGDPETMKTTSSPRPTFAEASIYSAGPTTDWHGQTSSSHGHSVIPDDNKNGNTTGNFRRTEIPRSAPRDSKMSLFDRTWSTISSALRDLEPTWAHRRLEAAMRHSSRPYTPSVYSDRTTDDNYIISRLSDIVEESWRDRSVLKTPEPAALIYTTHRGFPAYRGSKSDWDIENGSMI